MHLLVVFLLLLKEKEAYFLYIRPPQAGSEAAFRLVRF
jgi:hypothetical protein